MASFRCQAECTTILRYTLYSLLLTEWPQPTGHCHANEDLPPLGDVVDGGSFHLDIEKRPFSNTTLATAWYGHTTSILAPGWMSPIFLPHSFIFYSSEKPQAVRPSFGLSYTRCNATRLYVFCYFWLHKLHCKWQFAAWLNTFGPGTLQMSWISSPMIFFTESQYTFLSTRARIFHYVLDFPARAKVHIHCRPLLLL